MTDRYPNDRGKAGAGSRPRIGLIPLDERPCNEYFPRALAPLADAEIVTPPVTMLSVKRQVGQRENLGNWLQQEAPYMDGLVVSIETLVYGGLIPSRIGYEVAPECIARLDVLRSIRQQFPDLPIYAFNIVMRISNSNINEEEPEYWDSYGQMLWRYSRLHYRVHDLGMEEERVELDDLESQIPSKYIKDYTDRRERNHQVNLAVLDLVGEGVIDFLLFTQDDTSEFGFPNREQRILRDRIATLGVADRAMVYPGADEVGMVLVARHLNRWYQKTPKFFPRYSSIRGPLITANYEDRPIAESVKGQVFGVGGMLVDSPQDADIILFLNTPGESQGEAPHQHKCRTVDTSGRNLLEFVQAMQFYQEQSKVIALADLAYSNGADLKLVSLLQQLIDLRKLDAFGAWNTAGNTLGTVVAHAAVRHLARLRPSQGQGEREIAHLEFLLLRFADDWAYQSLVRTELREEVQPRLGIEGLDLGEQWPVFQQEAADRLKPLMKKFFEETLANRDVAGRKLVSIELIDVHLPWQRLFEVGCSIRIATRSMSEGGRQTLWKQK